MTARFVLVLLVSCLSLGLVTLCTGSEYDIFITLTRESPNFVDCTDKVKLEIEKRVEAAMDEATCGAYSGKYLNYISELDDDSDDESSEGSSTSSYTASHAGIGSGSGSGSNSRRLRHGMVEEEEETENENELDQFERKLWDCSEYHGCGAYRQPSKCRACCRGKCIGKNYNSCMGTGSCDNRRLLEEEKGARFLNVEDVTYGDFEKEMRRLDDLDNKERMEVYGRTALMKYALESESGNCLGVVENIKCVVDILQASDGLDCSSDD